MRPAPTDCGSENSYCAIRSTIAFTAAQGSALIVANGFNTPLKKMTTSMFQQFVV